MMMMLTCLTDPFLLHYRHYVIKWSRTLNFMWRLWRHVSQNPPICNNYVTRRQKSFYEQPLTVLPAEADLTVGQGGQLNPLARFGE